MGNTCLPGAVKKASLKQIRVQIKASNDGNELGNNDRHCRDDAQRIADTNHQPSTVIDLRGTIPTQLCTSAMRTPSTHQTVHAPATTTTPESDKRVRC